MFRLFLLHGKYMFLFFIVQFRLAMKNKSLRRDVTELHKSDRIQRTETGKLKKDF